MIKNFSDFHINSMNIFEQVFEQDDFIAFSRLSGDHNPLHHDASYAAASEFLRPIVPLHMTIAPLSRIAGMLFPGDPSLYLGHEIKSLAPVFFGDRLTYSARIIALNLPLRTLRIRVLAVRGTEVVMDAEMRVKSRLDAWPVALNTPDFAPPPPTVLITGATGAIGTALAVGMARRGWNLLLLDRGEGVRREALRSLLEPMMAAGQTMEFVTADLGKTNDLDGFCARLENRSDIAALLHTASPPLDAGLNDLVAVNYSALKKLAFAVAPSMLARQQGSVVAIGSIATERVIPGWWDYAAVKGMQSQFVAAFDRSYAEFGVRGLEVLSGLVATEYSRDFQDGAQAMLPEELAEQVLRTALDEKAGQAVIVELNRIVSGSFGFRSTASQGEKATTAAIPTSDLVSVVTHGVAAPGADVEPLIEKVMRTKLRLAPNYPLASASVGSTPGWDSLRHIEVLLELEAAFGVQFSASDVDKMLNYESLVSIVSARVAPNSIKVGSR